MTVFGLWSIVFAFGELFFGVLKSKGGKGLNFMFWASLGIEFACACVQSAALFIGQHGAFVVEFENRGSRMGTSIVVVLIDGILLIVEAAVIGRKLYDSDYFLRHSWLSTKIAVVLTALLVAPAIPLGITGFWPPINGCFVVNRSVLDPLTIIVVATPIICVGVAWIALRFGWEMHLPNSKANVAAMLVAYLCYSAPVLALGILLMRTPSDCDKHTILLISNLIPAVVTCCAAFVLEVGTNPNIGNPMLPGDNIGAGLAVVLGENADIVHSDASVRTPEKFHISTVSGSVDSHQLTCVLPNSSSIRFDY